MRQSFPQNNEFSWSLARYNLYKFCLRSYFYYYYGSWEGWHENATPEKQRIYRLKQLKKEKSWLDNIILLAITSALKKEIDPSINSIRTCCFRKLYAELASMGNREFLNDPKKLCLFSFYYQHENINSIRQRVTEKLNRIFDSIQNEDQLSLLQLSYINYISINELVNFKLGNVTLWHNPGFIYHNKDMIIINNLRFNNFRDDDNWAFSGAISMLYALKTLLRHNKAIEQITTFIYDRKMLDVHAFLNPGEAAEIILASSNNMLLMHNSGISTDKNHFSKCAEEEKCRTCIFYEACTADV